MIGKVSVIFILKFPSKSVTVPICLFFILILAKATGSFFLSSMIWPFMKSWECALNENISVIKEIRVVLRDMYLKY